MARYCHSLIVYTPSVILHHFPAEKVYEEINDVSHGLEQVLSCRQNLSLWFYFVGAVVEELAGKNPFNEHEGNQKANFQTKFQATANSLKLTSSKKISDILSCYLYSESLDVYIEGYI
jgi:hypothetical protein